MGIQVTDSAFHRRMMWHGAKNHMSLIIGLVGIIFATAAAYGLGDSESRFRSMSFLKDLSDEGKILILVGGLVGSAVMARFILHPMKARAGDDEIFTEKFDWSAGKKVEGQTQTLKEHVTELQNYISSILLCAMISSFLFSAIIGLSTTVKDEDASLVFLMNLIMFPVYLPLGGGLFCGICFGKHFWETSLRNSTFLRNNEPSLPVN